MTLLRCIGSMLLLIYWFDGTAATAQTDSTAVADSLFSLQLERSLQPEPSSIQQQSAPRSFLSVNPDISAIGDFRSAYTSIGTRPIDMYLNELEIQIASVVDPYARAEFIVSFGRDPESRELGIELEVATLTSLSLPYQLQLTLGKFKPVIGKVNVLHPHYFSFVDFPKVINNYFESEGMFMEGASASWLLPNPYDFYQELTVEVGRAGSEPNAAVAPGEDGQLLYVGHLKNFLDLGPNSTLEFGLSGVHGPNRFGSSTLLAGVDLTFKWKPLRHNVYRSFSWQSEVFYANMRLSDAEVIRTYGGFSFIEYQLERRWFVGARYDYSGFPDDPARKEQAASLLLRFQPTEFQILALQYQYSKRNYDRNMSQVVLRVIFGIGSHAAHQY